MGPKRDFVFLVNPAAWHRNAASRLDAYLERAGGIGAEHRSFSARDPCEAAAALGEVHRDAFPVAVGGDGTVALLVGALRARDEADRPFGVLPFGTGNAFAHAIGVGDTERAFSTLATGEARALDLMVTSHPEMPVALVSISAGFESRLLESLAKNRRVSPVVGAVRGAFDSLLRSWRGIELVLDGETVSRANESVHNVGLYNHRCYAKGVVVYPQADPTDGRGEAVVYRRAWPYMRALAKGIDTEERRDTPSVLVRRWSTAEFRSRLPFQADGESLAPGEMRVELERGAIRVLVPSEEAAPP